MPIYTRTGDNGKTNLFKGERHLKSKPIFDVLGTIDELNSAISLIPNIKSTKNNRDRVNKITSTLNLIQNTLFELGALIANTNTKTSDTSFLMVESQNLEKEIDYINEYLPSLTSFIIPGGNISSANAHFARAVSRRAERLIVKLNSGSKNKFLNVVKYINRLSDYLFTVARAYNFLSGSSDVLWKKRKI